ncbi:uncharacterized protein LOC120709642 [Panicum virgatum]|uniref:uncharacterized protein LOC120709642 n=1 Tax=Panicum virgatum TaxID=38727 RepID=UPI0019D600C4|nr:uncharacterized protein LOC120709642 [Panicum virgatum]
MLLGVGPPLGSAAGQPGIPAPAAGPCFEAATGRRHNCFLRDMAEDKASWRARVRDKACHTVAALKEELSAERARWQQRGHRPSIRRSRAELRDGAQGPRADGGGVLGAHTGGGAAAPGLLAHAGGDEGGAPDVADGTWQKSGARSACSTRLSHLQGGDGGVPKEQGLVVPLIYDVGGTLHQRCRGGGERRAQISGSTGYVIYVGSGSLAAAQFIITPFFAISYIELKIPCAPKCFGFGVVCTHLEVEFSAVRPRQQTNDPHVVRVLKMLMHMCSEIKRCVRCRSIQDRDD